MAPRRILILTNRIPYPLNDGGNLAMKAMVAGYHDAGWEVCLLSMNTSRHYIKKDVLSTIYKDIWFETVDVNNEVKPLPTLVNYFFSSKPNHAARFNHDGFRQRLKELLTSFKPDVVQLESVFLSGYLAEIKKSNAIAILRLHNIEWQVWQRLAEETRSPFKKIYLHNLAKRIRRYEEAVWRRFDLLLPITEVDAGTARAFNAHVLTVPFGVDTFTTGQGSAGEEWRSYHIGAMDWLPNAEAISWFLKEVWPLIHQKHPGLSFSYAGRNMPETFKSLNIAGTFCAGEVESADAFIADKNILIVPLRSGGGIRVKILEAMAAGKLVISTDVGMQGIEATPRQHYLKANTPGEFIEAIDFVYSQPETCRRIALNGAKLVITSYDKHAIMERLTIAISDMLKNRTM